MCQRGPNSNPEKGIGRLIKLALRLTLLMWKNYRTRISYLFHWTMPIPSAGWTSQTVQSHPNPPYNTLI